VDKVRKAKVQALAETKKGKSVDWAGELGEKSEGRKDCDSCRKKGWKCEWRSVILPAVSEFQSSCFGRRVDPQLA
jgi:hypothetical protein